MVGPRPLGGRCVLLGWGGVRWGMKFTFMWTCTWSRCYAVAVGHVFKAEGWGGVGWDNNGSATHTSWYATVRCVGLPRVRHAMLLDVVLDFYTYAMLRYWLLSCTSHIRRATLCSLGFPHIPHATLFLYFFGPPHVRHATQLNLVLDLHA